MTVMDGRVLALAGGVGGAKLAWGLAQVLPPERLVVGVNTGDDDDFHGLHVSPDLDTITYTLAGLSNPETGWGLAGDTFNALEMLKKYQVDTWFNLGDRDLATHIRRTQLLKGGATLSQVTQELCQSLGIGHRVVPMSDQPVRTVISTPEGDLPMQNYFVQRRSEPRVLGIAYNGSGEASPAPALAEALVDCELVVFCPSNPFLSVGPILAVPGIREGLRDLARPRLRVAVSPIVGGDSVKGPAGKIMAELGKEVSCVGVAREYRDVCDVLLIDEQDAGLAAEIRSLGVEPVVAPIIMDTEADKMALAKLILDLKGS